MQLARAISGFCEYWWCSLVRPVLQPNDLVVFADCNSPDLPFCLDSRAWLLSEPDTTTEKLQQA